MSRLLLDTHVFLWWRIDDRRIDETCHAAIANADLVYVSAASAWEIAIKQSVGKLRLHTDDSVVDGIRDSRFEPLLVKFPHAEEVARLPLHHRDPFDRLLVAQAIVEDLSLVTNDKSLEPYDIDILWNSS